MISLYILWAYFVILFSADYLRLKNTTRRLYSPGCLIVAYLGVHSLRDITAYFFWLKVFYYTNATNVDEMVPQILQFMLSSVFWDITPCSPLKVSRCFGGTCRLHLQG
jgi:hypothetical protein